MHSGKIALLVLILILSGVSFALYQSGYFSAVNEENTETLATPQEESIMFDAQKRAESLNSDSLESDIPVMVDSQEMTIEEFAAIMSLTAEEAEKLFLLSTP